MCTISCETCTHSGCLTMSDVATCNCCEDHEFYNPMEDEAMELTMEESVELTSDQKRSYINHRCRAYEIDDSCVCTLGDKKCPFSDDPTAWCKVGHLSDVSDDQLDAIVAKFEEVQS